MATLTSAESVKASIGDTLDVPCPLCLYPKVDVLPFRYAFRDRFLFGTQCRRCDLVFIHPQPTSEEIEELYREEYFTEHSDRCGAHGADAYMALAAAGAEERRRSAARMDRRLRRRLPKRGRYLEVGCGPGFFLAEMKRLGWQAAGLEISTFGTKHARETLGLDVTQDALDQASLPAGSFDAVFMGDVLEHLPRPLASLRRLHTWLAPGGVAVIAVPSTLNLPSAQLGLAYYRARSRWKTLRIPPYHLFEYRPATLRMMIEKAGFRVAELRQSAVPIGKMGLRGSRLENVAKVALQVPAILSSKLFNAGGDRLLAVAVKEAKPS